MASLPIVDMKGNAVGTYEIDPAALAPRINRQLLHDVVVMYQASQRQGTHRTKTRSEVAGSSKKMYRQKGTGNARMGTKRSGTRRGGGHIFAIRPRDYSYRLPKKALRAATRMALAGKITDDLVTVIDKLSLKEIKTREMAGVLKALKLDGESTLIATAEHDPVVCKSVRNMRGVEIAPVRELNAWMVMVRRRLLVTRDALDWLTQESAAAAPSARARSPRRTTTAKG
jgi:large subunit ribosomal protein L4